MGIEEWEGADDLLNKVNLRTGESDVDDLLGIM